MISAKTLAPWTVVISLIIVYVLIFLLLSHPGWFTGLIIPQDLRPLVIAWVVVTLLSYFSLSILGPSSLGGSLDMEVLIRFFIGSVLVLILGVILFTQDLWLGILMSIIVFVYYFWLFLYLYEKSPWASAYLIPSLVVYAIGFVALTNLALANNVPL
jgi:tryptophan-rich sensory protein